MKAKPEDITVLCLHDADGPGTVIAEKLRKSLEPLGVRFVDLGLNPDEAREMGLEPERVTSKKKEGGKKKAVPVASHLSDENKRWLQSYRIEMNAMTTAQMLAFIDRKMAALEGKVVPPAEVVRSRFEDEARKALTASMTAEAIRRANVAVRVEAEMNLRAAELRAAAGDLAAELPAMLRAEPLQHWSALAAGRAEEFVAGGRKPEGGA